MSLNLLKTGAIAATVLAMTVSGAFAATYGVMKYDTTVRASWTSASAAVNFVEGGDEVQIIDYHAGNGGWFKLSIPGPNGWVKKSRVELEDTDPEEPGVNFCFYGPLGYICVNK